MSGRTDALEEVADEDVDVEADESGDRLAV